MEELKHWLNNPRRKIGRRSDSKLGSQPGDITLIDQLLEIYRALEKRWRSTSLENEDYNVNNILTSSTLYHNKNGTLPELQANYSKTRQSTPKR